MVGPSNIVDFRARGVERLVLKNVLGICQFAMFSDAIVQKPKKLNQSRVDVLLR